MSDSNDDKPNKPSGRVHHDKSGRAVWQWAVDSGKFAIESTSRLLEKLDLSHLSIEGDEKDAAKHAEELRSGDSEPDKQSPTGKDPVGAKRAYNPYDTRASASNMKTGKPLPPAKPRITQPVRPAKNAGFLGRLFGKEK